MNENETIQCPIPPRTRDAVASELQGLLVDLVDLGLQAKQAHWTVWGPRFRPLHEMLDEIASAARGHADTVAERCVAIGRTPDANALVISRSTKLPPYPSGFVSDEIVAHTMAQRLADVAARAHAHVRALGQLDPISEDVAIAVARDIDQLGWMAQATAGTRIETPARGREKATGKTPGSAPARVEARS